MANWSRDVNIASRTLKIAVIGAGLIGERHARLLNELDGFELCGVIDPSARSKDLATELETVSFASIEDFFDRNIACDGAIIATPNETHLLIAEKCLKREIPCLIEKPLAANSNDAIAIENVAQEHAVKVLVGHHRRHHVVSRILKEKIDAGALGKLVGAQLTWMLRKPEIYFDTGIWRIQKGGGPIWINLIHEIDLLRYFMGEIIEVSAYTSNAIRGNAVEDSGVINMRCQSGAMVSAIVSDAAPSPWHFEGGSGENPNICETGEGGLRIFGTQSSIEFPSLKEWRHGSVDGHWGTPILSEAEEISEDLGGEVALAAQLRNFAGVINGTELPLVSAKDGVQSVRVIEAIHLSAVNGISVTVPTI